MPTCRRPFRLTMTERSDLARVALGQKDPDHIFVCAQLFLPYTGETVPANLWTYRGRVAHITFDPVPSRLCRHVIPLPHGVVVPAFVDGHIHTESTLLAPESFATMALDYGVGAVVTDLHEVAAVGGRQAIEELLDHFDATQLKAFLVSPSAMPFLPKFERPKGRLTPEDVEALLDLPGTLGLNEIHGHEITSLAPKDLAILRAALDRGLHLEGHLFRTRGDELSANVALGLGSDHEPRAREEVWEKLRKGLFVMLRQGSIAREVDTLIDVALEQQLPTHDLAMVTDDILPGDVMERGYMLEKLRLAVGKGFAPQTALQMVTVNPARYYGIDDRVGSLRIGSFADFVVLKDLQDFDLMGMYVEGEIWAHGSWKDTPAPFTKDYSETSLHSIPLQPVTPQMLVPGADRLAADAPSSMAAQAIRLDLNTRFTELKPVRVEQIDGELVLPPDQDLLFLTCLQRTGDAVGHGLLADYGLRDGAIALSVAHDHHNIVVLGKTAGAMAMAVNRLIQRQGGVIYAGEEGVRAEIPLPLAGLVSPKPYGQVAREIESLTTALRHNGVTWPVPLFFLFFLAMPAAPRYRITDQGVVDVFDQAIVDVFKTI